MEADPVPQEEQTYEPAVETQNDEDTPVPKSAVTYGPQISAAEFQVEAEHETSSELGKLALFRAVHPDNIPERRQRGLLESVGEDSWLLWIPLALLVLVIAVILGNTYKNDPIGLCPHLCPATAVIIPVNSTV